MSTIAPTKAASTKPKKEKKEKAQQQQGAERLKTVVRRLPPNLPEEVFWQSVQPWVTDETVTWKIYMRGKFRSRLNKENIPSRAYIAFKNDEQLALFSKEYDGHVFRDKAGNESQAVVEFAPYQKVPSEKKKPDARIGTIEKDESYISFVQSLSGPSSEPVTLEALIASTQPVPQPKTTPLLEALKAEKAEKTAVKEKVSIMRNQAHEAARKEEGKKKGAPPKPAEASGPPIGKKAAKKAAAAAAAAKDSPATSQKDAAPASAANAPKHPTKAQKAAARQQLQQQQSQSQTQPAKAQAQALSIPSRAASAASSSSAAESPATPSTPTPSRRGRPILGLGSRQFEAALNSAGVSERKSRKEREREREEASKEKESRAKDAPPAAAATSKPNPPSPKRDRGGKRNENASHGESSGNAKIPSILQRIDGPPTILQRGAAAGADGASKSSAVTPAAPEQAGTLSGPGTSRGGRHGRGRGRGSMGRGG